MINIFVAFLIVICVVCLLKRSCDEEFQDYE